MSFKSIWASFGELAAIIVVSILSIMLVISMLICIVTLANLLKAAESVDRKYRVMGLIYLIPTITGTLCA